MQEKWFVRNNEGEGSAPPNMHVTEWFSVCHCCEKEKCTLSPIGQMKKNQQEQDYNQASIFPLISKSHSWL